jgi:hypothetical protein
MSKGGGGGTQTTMSQTQLPDWVNQAAMSNYQQATQVSQNLMKPYAGQRVADMPGGMTSDINALQGNIGSTNAPYQQAMAGTTGVMGYQPAMVNPQSLAGMNLQPYMNPYLGMVAQPTLQLMQQQNQQQLNQIGQQAAMSNAFGGSRQGVAEGVQNAQSQMQQGQMLGNLLSGGYQQAQAGATGDIQRNLQAQQLNQAALAQGAGLQLGAAGQLGTQAGQQQQNYLQGLQAAMAGQTALQQQQQSQLGAAQQYYTEQQQYPIEQLQILQNALSVSPYGQTTYAQGPGPESSGLMQGLGAAASIAGIVGKIAPLFGSDRRLKTDIRRMGHDQATDLPLYAYRYKGDPKSYPKVVGPMAQDVAEKFPDQVAKVGGYLAIKGNFLAGMREHANA